MKKNLENTRDDPLYPSKEFLLERKRKKSMLQNSFSTEREEQANYKLTLTTPRVIHALSFPSPRRKEGRKERKEGRNEAHVWKSNIEGGVRAKNFIHKSERWMVAVFAVPDINCIYAPCPLGSGYYDRSRRIISNPWHVTHTWLRLGTSYTFEGWFRW